MRFYRQSFYNNYLNASGWEDKELTLDMILYELSDLSNEKKSDVIDILKKNNISISKDASITSVFDRLANNLNSNSKLRDDISAFVVNNHAKESKDKDSLIKDISYHIEQFYLDAKDSELLGEEEMKKKLYLLADQQYKNNLKVGNMIFIGSLIFIVGIVIWDYYKGSKGEMSEMSDSSEMPNEMIAEDGMMVDAGTTMNAQTNIQPNTQINSTSQTSESVMVQQ